MSVHLDRAIAGLKKKVLELSSLVEESVFNALKAVQTRDSILAQQVIEGDARVDMMEVEVEEECLKMLALHQPVATDLRFIVAVLKINNDLERIGDLAVNIASRAKALCALSAESVVVVDFKDTPSKVQHMLRQSLEALVNSDESAAKAVCASDDEVDESNRRVHKQVIQAIRECPSEVDKLMITLSVSRNLERIADHATNIAEDVLYMVHGEIVRHAHRL